MVFYIADPCILRGEALAAQLRLLFPDGTVLIETNPLEAGEYCFTHPVDVLYAAWHMEWLDGPRLGALARRGNPGVRVYLLAQPEDLEKHTLPPGVSGLLARPVQERVAW